MYLGKTFDLDGSKVGYLMYNSFTADYDAELNDAFAALKAEGATDLILDLRYNGGGSVNTAVGLASMITGQFKGEVFMKEQWNDKYQNAFAPESYINLFQDEMKVEDNNGDQTTIQINSLNLNKLYVLTTTGTASASELIINGLDPYINVVQVGTKTTGKYQASVTLYDGPGFGRKGANLNHTYAMQPLVLKSANKLGKSDYYDGLPADISVEENLANLGTLGDQNEPLLKAALNDIQGIPQDSDKQMETFKLARKFKILGGTGMEKPNYQKMYIDKVPGLGER